MLLIVGGAFQGKLETAKQLTGLLDGDFLDGADCPLEKIYTARGIRHFHEYIRRMLKEGRSPEGFLQKLFAENPGIVLISTELGYGIVPMDPFDRLYRETTGRVCCEAARLSEKVYRVIAGIPCCIKGETSCE